MQLSKVEKQGLINFNANQKFIMTNCQYEVISGSYAYGVSGDSSDCDIVGFCIPPKNMIFPHLDGHILGFGTPPQRFDQWQKHHIIDGVNKKEYDFTIYSIIKFFALCMENNPNMVDALFVPLRCITHSTEVGNLVRENRKIFLHKGSWHKFRGYAFSQIHKAETKNPEGKRKEIVEKFGYDVKFAYHVVRLLDECEQILLFGDIDLERSRDYLKAIRRGDVKFDEIKAYFATKEPLLEKLYHESTAVPYSPDESAIKDLLIKCLEIHYGSLDAVISKSTREQDILKDEEKTAREICYKITALGYTAYLAGGCVRDMLLGRTPKDFDIASDCPTEVLNKEFKTCDIGGAKYGVVRVLVEDAVFEVAMFREDGEYTDGRRPDSVKLATPETDATRRDFTINALFFDPTTYQIIDYVTGQFDLERRLIKTVGNPIDRFNEDYLRMIRAIRFSAELGFYIENSTFFAIAALHNKIQYVSGERIRDELLKILKSHNPEKGMRDLFDCRILNCILPEVERYIGCEQPIEFHPEGDVWQHTMLMLNGIKFVKYTSLMFPLAVLLHDVGKPSTKTIIDGVSHFYLHEDVGEQICETIMRRLAFSNEDIETVKFLVGNHMRAKCLTEMKMSKKKKLMRHPLFFDLMELHRLDCLVTGRLDDTIDGFIEEAKNTPPERLKPISLVNGDDLLVMGFKQGPIIGAILKAVEDAQLEETISTREEALTLAESYGNVL